MSSLSIVDIISPEQLRRAVLLSRSSGKNSFNCPFSTTFCALLDNEQPKHAVFPNLRTMMPEDYEALAQLRYLGRKFLRFSKDFLRSKCGLNPEQYEALLAIKAFPDNKLTIAQLSERLQVRHHSAINIVDRLSARKLITRKAAEPDRRARYVELTAEGGSLIEELALTHHRELCERSDEMIEALKRILTNH